MKRYLLAGILALPIAATADILECTRLAGEYSRNPFALTMRELDTLRLCVSEQIRLMVESKEAARVDKAIGRNFNAE
jgi:hypothetical protein